MLLFRILIFVSIAVTLSVAVSAQCPQLMVTGPAGVTQPGDEMRFIFESPKSEYRYSWTVSGGTIVKGQGTSAIEVATDKSLSGSNITATVEVGGLSPICEKTATATAPVDLGFICGLVMDEWEGLKPNDERARFDSFFAELSNNPNNQGIVILQVTANERLDDRNPRVRLLMSHVRFRKFDANRIWIMFEPSDFRRTKIYRVPPGADLPPCDGPCTILKAGDIR